jgi:hypothetical protein
MEGDCKELVQTLKLKRKDYLKFLRPYVAIKSVHGRRYRREVLQEAAELCFLL